MNTPLASLANRFALILCGGCMIFSGWNLAGLDVAHGESPLSTEEETSIVVDPKLEDLTFFQKKWSCSLEGEEFDVDKREATAPYTWDMVRELNNLWFFAISYQQAKDVSKVENWGYNTIIQKYGRTIIGNDGTFANFLSDGWQDNTMVWQGSSSNLVSQASGKHQMTITKTGDSSFTEVEQKSTGEDEWTVVSSKTCTVAEST